LNNNELEFKKTLIQAENLKTIFGFFSVAATLYVIYLCVDKAFTMITAVAGNSPSSIEALAKLVNALQLSKMAGTIIGVMGVGYGVYERKGKKRAIGKVAEFRKQLEANDPHNGSSGLTKSGDTPKTRKK